MEFKIKAVLDKDGYYKHFGINPSFTNIYGVKVEDIRDVIVTIHEDQTKPGRESGEDLNRVDYWGWYDARDEKISSLVFQKRFLLNMCFPYGMEAEEELGRGKAYRVKVQEV